MRDKVKIGSHKNLENIMLVLSSGVCFLASFKLKVQILSSDKAMVLKIVRAISFLSTLILAVSLIFVMFIDDNKCVCIVFIFILTVDAFRAIKLAIYTKDKHKVDIKDYLISLKWISFGMLSFIICGSLFYNVSRALIIRDLGLYKQGIFVESTANEIIKNSKYIGFIKWLDYFLLFFQQGSMVPRSVSVASFREL